MPNVDYIVVGLGIAGISFCEQLDTHGKSFVVYDSGTDSATETAGGVINPTVLKRFTPVWNAQTHVREAFAFYESLSEKLGITLVEPTQVLRIFNDVEEQNNWMVASDKNDLRDFLSSELIPNTNAHIIAPYGFGRVNRTGRVHTGKLISEYKKYLRKKGRLNDTTFDYDQITHVETGCIYDELTCGKIVFSEGPVVRNNPFFPSEFLIPNKGDYLIIEAPDLKLDAILKGPMFVIPLGKGRYKVGATFDKGNPDATPSEAKREEIIAKLSRMINCDYEVLDHIAGVRPTTRDRRPLLGSFPDNPNLGFFSGLGTRGIMAAPTMAGFLYEYLENGTPIPGDLNLTRFL